jgi:hypothetical protein
MTPAIAEDKHVHRQLALTSPAMRGPDVRRLQFSLNDLADHYKFPWRKINTDGVLGRRTRELAHFGAWLIGLSEEGRLEVIRKQGRITEEVQSLLRNPESRSSSDRAREETRRPKMQKLRQQRNELEKGMEFMLSHKGVNEEPAGSNKGPFPINACQEWYGLLGVPWCGCAVGFSIEKYGLGGEKTGTWWPHAETIRLDAERGQNGLIDVRPAQIMRFDVVTMWPGGSDDDDHVTWATGDVDGNGNFPTVEGNTSSAFRSSDGGIIETKTHHISEVTCAARLVGQV